MMPRTRPGGLVIAGVLFLLAAPGRATEYFVDFSARPGVRQVGAALHAGVFESAPSAGQ
jgi:hypothetical protein